MNTGTPRYYSIDESANEMLLVPVPATSAEQVSFHYLRDCEIPDYKYASSTWSFYVKGTNTALPATYTNDWLKNALELIVNRACYLMLGGTYGGDEGSQVRANMYMQKWADELNRLRGENARRASVAGVRRWLR